MLRGLLDQSRDGLLALDEKGTIIEANLAAAAILAHKRSALVGKPLAALVALDDRRALRTALIHATLKDERLELRFHDGGAPWTVTVRVVPGTSPRTVVAALVPTSDGQPVGQQQPKARPRGERIEQFALRFPHAVVALDRDGRVAFANARARAVLDAAALRTGELFAERVPAELATIARRLIEVPAPLQPTLLELGDSRVVRVSGLASAGDEPVVIFLEDVTEQQTQERVTREFLRNAAHQLRTPLAGIMAAIETLQAGAKERPEDRDRFLTHLETHAARLTRIARGLLVLARAQAGEQLRVDLVQLEPLLAEAVAAADPRAGVAVEAHCEQGLAAVASPELLQETLAALVENAVSHTHAGSIQLSAATQNGSVAVSVTDTGGGILPEFRERVFEPFYRVGDDGRGHGLGLAIAAQAVQAMGGSIEVSGAPGSGTTFTVTLRSGNVLR